MKSYDEPELRRELKELASQISVPPTTLRLRRQQATPLTAFAVTAVVIVLALVVGQALSAWRSQGPASTSGQPVGSPSTSGPATASTSAVSSPFVPFPDLTLLAGDQGGRVYKVRSGQVVGGPVQACVQGSIAAIYPNPNGHTALALCETSDVAAGSAVLIDTDAMTLLPQAQTVVGGRADAAAWSPDGRVAALLQPGSRTDVAEAHISLWDVSANTTRVVRPDQGLLFNLRWTSVGLSVSIPQSSDKGTWVWDGASWSHYSSRYLWIVDGSRELLVDAPPATAFGGTVWLRTGDQEQQLSGADTEFPLGLDGDRAVVGAATSIVVYHGQSKDVIPTPVMCTGAQRSGRWLVCSGAGAGSLVLAYSLDARAPAKDVISALSGVTRIAPLP